MTYPLMGDPYSSFYKNVDAPVILHTIIQNKEKEGTNNAMDDHIYVCNRTSRQPRVRRFAENDFKS